MLLGDQYFSRINPCAPVSTTLPGLSNENTHDQIGRMLCRLLSLVGFHTGGLNIEVIKGNDDKIYFIEIGPRSGGNFMPELAQLATGFDLAYANVNAVLGDPVDFIFHRKEGHFYTQVILHSSSDGKYLNIAIPESFKKNEKFRIIYYNKGDKINKYCGSSNVIGVILYEFDNHAECKSLINFITSKELVVIN
jgi:biotin carboxylase